MIRLAPFAAVVACLLGCPQNGIGGDGGGAGGSGGGGGAGGGTGGGAADAGAVLSCRPCVTSADCDSVGACTQYSGDAFCAKSCSVVGDCAASEDCALATDFGGGQVRVCLPRSGSCTADAGCGVCPTGTSCDLTQGTCEGPVDAGAPDAGACGTKLPPASASCCHACTAGSAGCQTNGCFGGWWCDEVNPSACSCKAPPTSCGGGSDAGAVDAGPPDAGPLGDGGFIGPNGGAVNRLYFAVVGDTRPPTPTNGNYPTAIINKIYADIAALNPRPQFVIGTGDYQFSSPFGNDGAVQLGYYLTAKSQYPGTLFAAMGNHECTTPTASNCVGTFTRKTYDAYIAALVTPLGKANPYYSFPVQTSAGVATFILTACNAWDATQKAWLQGELSNGSTFKIIVRHESLTATAPCSAEMNPMLQASAWNLLLVGHTHLFSHSGKQLIVGMGGAPISGSTPYGYITVEQLAQGGWHVIQYDSTTSMQVSNFTVP